MAVPVQVASNIRDEKFAGVTYHIEGELVPVLQVELSQVPFILSIMSCFGRI